MKKFLFVILSIFVVVSLMLCVVSCQNASNIGETSVPNDSTSIEETVIREIYNKYVIEAETQGEEPLDYESWLMNFFNTKGEQGEEGKSAYDIWLKAGNTGTEEEFLEWLKGEAGAQGEQGEQGAQGVGIEKVEYDENGNLVVTFTNGTTQTVEAPQEHVHTYGEWNMASDEATLCENRVFFRVCSTCNDFDWKQGMVDDHIVASSGECTVCRGLVGATDGVVYKVSDDGTFAEVVGYEGSALRVRIADTYENLPVKSIGSNAFYQKPIITIVLPDSLNFIAEDAFAECDSLNYNVDDYLSADGNLQYLGSTSTPYFYLVGVTSTNIKNATINKNCKFIGASVFLDCHNLTKVEIPDGVISIGSRAFSGCISLTGVVIPDNVTSIGDYAFSLCGLTSIEIPDGLTSINNYVFYDCAGLMSVKIGEGVTSIGFEAFRDCTSLTSIEIPEGVISTGSSVFYNCSALINVILPNSLVYIDGGAFYNCSDLTNIIIPINVASIALDAFGNCSKLLNVFYKGNEEMWNKIYIDSSNMQLTKSSLHFYSETEPALNLNGTAYNNNYWYYNDSGDFESWAYKLQGGSIGLVYVWSGSFYKVVGYMGKDSNVVIPQGVETIGGYAFYNCNSITNITIPDSVKSIESYAFYNCNGLANVVIGDGVTSINSYTFCNCSALKRVVIGRGVTSIDNNIFYNCDNLESVEFEDVSDWYRTISYTKWKDKKGGTGVNVTNEYVNAESLVTGGSYWYKK